MKTTYKQYPHPVLDFFNNDYKNSTFTKSVNVNNQSDKFELTVNFNLSCNTLQTLLDNKKAAYVVHLECKGTRFRMCYETTDSQLIIPIDPNKINNHLEVVISIVSKCNIKNFASPEFHDDFNNTSFDIHIGDILAIAEDIEIRIKKSDIGSNISASLFNITLSDTNDPITWYIDNSSILVKLPQNIYSLYKNLNTSNQAHNILTNTIVIPILTEVLTTLKMNPDYYDDADFIDTLNFILKGINLQIDDLKNIECISNISFKLVDNVLYNSLSDLETLLLNGGN